MPFNNPPQKTQTLLITGCSSGIGYHAAHYFHQKGYHVIASCRKSEDVERLQQEGLHCFQLDLADPEGLERNYLHILAATGGKIDILFNNAAFGLPGAVEDLSREALKFQFETNVFGTQHLTNLVIPTMRQQGYGKILYNSSILGFAAMAYRGAYNASKFAIEGLADTLRLELKDTDIEVILIQPGPITSNFRQNAYQQFKHWIKLENSQHTQAYQAMIKRLSQEEKTAPFTLEPEAVTQAVEHAILHTPAKIRYPITLPTKVFAWLKRLLPNNWLDYLLLKAGGNGKR